MPLNTSKFCWYRTGERIESDPRHFSPVVFNLARPLPTTVIAVCAKLRHQSFLSREYEATLSLGKESPQHIQRLHSVGETHNLSQCGWLNTLNPFMDLLKVMSWQHCTLPTPLNAISCCPCPAGGGKACRMSKSQQYLDTFLPFTSVKIRHRNAFVGLGLVSCEIWQGIKVTCRNSVAAEQLQWVFCGNAGGRWTKGIVSGCTTAVLLSVQKPTLTWGWCWLSRMDGNYSWPSNLC